jgi:putative flippase GtrA
MPQGAKLDRGPADSDRGRGPHGLLMATAEAGQARGAWQRQADWTWSLIQRIHLGARRPANWAQLLQFGVVGAVGYAVNLGVFAVLTLALGVEHIPAAVLAFSVAVSNNFLWNRVWTFRKSAEGGDTGFQATRFFAVSLGGLAVNLVVLSLLVDVLGAPDVPSQALAIAVAMPVNFIGNKLWTFAWS